MEIWEIGPLEVEVQHKQAQKIRESDLKGKKCVNFLYCWFLHFVCIYEFVGYCAVQWC